MTRSLGWAMARAMASPLRVKNTAYFDIAPPTHRGNLHRPLPEGYAPTTRPTSEQDQSAACPRGNGAGGQATTPDRGLLPRSGFDAMTGPRDEIRAAERVFDRAGIRARAVAAASSIASWSPVIESSWASPVTRVACATMTPGGRGDDRECGPKRTLEAVAG